MRREKNKAQNSTPSSPTHVHAHTSRTIPPPPHPRGLHLFPRYRTSRTGWMHFHCRANMNRQTEDGFARPGWGDCQKMQFAPYNIHVCISKGNVVYEAHVILLQLNCKGQIWKNLLQNFTFLYRSHVAPFFFSLFLPSFPLKDGVRASHNYNIVFESLT